MLLYYYKSQFSKLKKSNSNSVFWISLINSAMLHYVLAWHMSFQTWQLIDPLQLHPWIFELTIHLPSLYFTILSLGFLDKTTKFMIYINSQIQKLVFVLIQRLDGYYFRKYRRSSPVSEFIFTVTQRFQKMDQIKKRKILLVSGVLVAIYYLIRSGVILSEKSPEVLI